MEVYRSEEEQLEALKRWWKENSRSVILGIVVGASVVGGWGIWQSNKRTQGLQASDLYQQLLAAMKEERLDSALKLSERLTDIHSGTSYAVYGHLFIAKLKTESGDVAAAKRALQTILDSDADDSFKHTARIRLIRILAAEGEFDAGFNIIARTDSAESGSFEGNYEELRGDLYVALKKDGEARTSYQRAQQLGRQSPFLELKLNDLEAFKIPDLSQE